jgi:hypothetical protein
MDGLVKGLVWVGSRTEHYEQMVEFYRDTLIYQKGSGGPQKPFSWLSEGVRGVFTINTEAGEQACIPHFHILCATPMSSWSRGRWCGRIFLRNFSS